MTYVIIALIAYFFGNITGSYIVSKLGFSEDIRTKGSGNAGTTNIFRNYGIFPALITLLIDVSKGYLAVLVASKFDAKYGIYLASIMVVVGHCWPIVLGFKGGKGVATTAGVMLYHAPILLIVGVILFFIIVGIGKIVSLASILLMVFGVISMLIFKVENVALKITTIILALIVIYCHRENIVRIKEGRENKISFKRG